MMTNLVSNLHPVFDILRSNTGLLYQLTEKGKYEITFYKNKQPVKTVTISVNDSLVDLGTLVI